MVNNKLIFTQKICRICYYKIQLKYYITKYFELKLIYKCLFYLRSTISIKNDNLKTLYYYFIELTKPYLLIRF
jgi:hypothetical protein